MQRSHGPRDTTSFYHFVGRHLHDQRDRETKLLGRFEIDVQVVFRRLQDRPLEPLSTL
jgi:hypothetical protein